MAYWVTDRDGTTFVSYASSESRVLAEAEKRGINVDEVIAVSSDLTPEDLEKYEQLSGSPLLKCKLLCLTAGQASSVLACVGSILFTLSMMVGPGITAARVVASVFSLVVGSIVFFTSAALFVEFGYVKWQLTQ